MEIGGVQADRSWPPISSTGCDATSGCSGSYHPIRAIRKTLTEPSFSICLLTSFIPQALCIRPDDVDTMQ